MWLIITLCAAIVTTVIWYVKAPDDKYKLGLLSLAFWGAAIMWLVDHLMAYAAEGGDFFESSRNATLLGVSVLIFALLAWLSVLLLSDPKSIIKKFIKR